ncbi:YtxH domain-containing protein [Paenibacillus sp. L3-i20]|uniref:YtxH domain-containing protein n=1 Tax=Paenibacillus sp. L3-i20 TaxID=2905833 RepID=UPI001EDD7E31|nr:YtxH domain-containing protein [Paenibacillus sp. L3-i20]GKU79920.1 hypothetical protein L3i20_v243170 [Paenibacillus sp. L3-i20]
MTTRKGTKGFLLGALAGGVLGSITALLLAPKPGKELRQDISSQARKVGEGTIKAAGKVGEQTGRFARGIGDQAIHIVDLTKQAAGNVVSSVKGFNKSETNDNTTAAIATISGSAAVVNEEKTADVNTTTETITNIESDNELALSTFETTNDDITLETSDATDNAVTEVDTKEQL